MLLLSFPVAQITNDHYADGGDKENKKSDHDEQYKFIHLLALLQVGVIISDVLLQRRQELISTGQIIVVID